VSPKVAVKQKGPKTFANRGEKFRLRSEKFRLRTDKFRLRNDFVSPSASQAIEIVGARNLRIRGFVQFQELTSHFVARLRAAFFVIGFPIRTSRLVLISFLRII
jgi:hypothetical protein